MKVRNLDLEKQILKEQLNDVDYKKQARKEKIFSDYRKYAHIKDDDPIDMIDEWALNEACFQNNYNKELLRKDLEQFRSK